ncbi:hypothetical protein M3175_18690 [Robertmurraya korlensis]|uniref:NAD(P)-dependent oxidoreductase n=1 Tax=Robertmurraya korlensis TaxID=519977 RepID=UPI00203F8085|nr:NAD(P)-dependent oxidoreductase [Robertmurraya korlensis]MCM3602767.1 hypothetical protein [Robertmurraya korlensis]
MNVYYTKQNRDLEAEQEYGAKYSKELSELLKVSNYVCVTVPLTAETRNMISHQKFRVMKSTANILNEQVLKGVLK